MALKMLTTFRFGVRLCRKVKLNGFRGFSSSAKPSLASVDPPIKIKDVYSISGEGLSVLFNDSASCDFKHIWLRDSCQCEECVHPQTKQKLLDPCTIDSTVHPVSWLVDDKGHLQIDWSDKVHSHRSSYSPAWLLKVASMFSSAGSEASKLDDELYRNLRKPNAEYWDRNKILQVSPQVSYSDFMENSSTLKKLLDFVLKYGIAMITGVPPNKGQIVKVAERIAYVRKTGYGETFDVKYNPDPKTHLSYTGTRFEHHTDLAYRERSPGVQLLHCIKAADPDTVGKLAGGESFFADAFFAAEWLRLHHPKEFSILTTTPVMFSFLDSQREMWFREKWPVISIDERQRLREVHYSIFSMRAPLLPADRIISFYQAFKTFSKKIREETSQMTFYLKKGDLVLFNNRRILHGRSEYDHHKVERYLQGCYMDLDEFYSLHEKIECCGS